MTPATALLILAWVAIVLLALALGGVVAQLRGLHSIVTRHGGSPARVPMVGKLVDGDGDVVNPPYAALFVTPGCVSCRQVVPAVVEVVDRVDKTVPVFVVSDQIYSAGAIANRESVTWLVDSEAAQRYGIPAFPWLVVVDAEGNPTDHDVARSPEDVAGRIRNASPTALVAERNN